MSFSTLDESSHPARVADRAWLREPSRAGRRPRDLETVAWLAVLLLPQIAAFVWPELASHLAYDRAAIAAGEIWRLATGHLVHWSVRHFTYDAIALALLAWTLGRTGGTGIGSIVAASTLAISTAIWLLRPDLLEYRGLSGIASALFAGVAVSLAERSRGRTRAIVLLGLVGFAIKVSLEALCDRALFVRGDATVVPEAHWVGALAGLVVCLSSIAWRRRRREVSTQALPQAARRR